MIEKGKYEENTYLKRLCQGPPPKEWDLLAVQESRLGDDSEALAKVEAALKEGKVKMYRGALGPDGVCLVAFLVRRGAITVLGSLPEGDPSRSLSVVWYVGGQSPIRVTNLYCENEGTAEIAARVSGMVDGGLAQAEAAGGIPALVCGDLNHELGSLDVVATVAASGWSDLGAPTPTCIMKHSIRPRRIDVMLASPALLARVLEAHVSWTTGIVSHAFQTFEGLAGRLPQIPRWKAAQAFAEPLLPMQDPEALFREIFRGWEAAWAESVEARSLEGMWRVIDGIATDFHRLRAGEEAGVAREPGRVYKAKDFPPPARAGMGRLVPSPCLSRCSGTEGSRPCWVCGRKARGCCAKRPKRYCKLSGRLRR